jgi:hypothetical protein
MKVRRSRVSVLIKRFLVTKGDWPLGLPEQ